MAAPPPVDLPVPVFPLMDTVLFPTALLPFHVVDRGHLGIVRESLGSHRLLAVAMTRRVSETDERSGYMLCPLACLARIEQVEWRVEDTYDLVFRGLTRVRLGRLVRHFPYPVAVVEPQAQTPYPEDDPLVELEKRALLEAWERFARDRELPGTVTEVSDPGLRFETLVNQLAMALPVPAAQKLLLLEMDGVFDRSQAMRAMIDHLRRHPRGGGPAMGDLGEN